MDIRKCEIFAITAETGNISRTAELTGYTQSGVSHTLKSFEEEVGVQLLRRSRYGVQLTPIGKEFLSHVLTLLAENNKVEQFVADLHGLEVGTLTIGTFKSVSIHWLPSLLYTFQEAHPNIHIQLKEGGIYDIEDWIANHEVDVAFYSRQPKHNFQFIHLADDPIVAVLPKDYALEEGKDSFPIQEFNGKPFILSEMGVDYDIHRILKETSISPDIRFLSKDDYAIMSMVEHHLGISILPELIMKGRAEDFITLPLEPAFTRDLGLGLLEEEHQAPIVKTFVEFVKEWEFPKNKCV